MDLLFDSLVGRTPSSAADPPVDLLCMPIKSRTEGSDADEGVRPTKGLFS